MNDCPYCKKDYHKFNKDSYDYSAFKVILQTNCMELVVDSKWIKYCPVCGKELKDESSKRMD